MAEGGITTYTTAALATNGTIAFAYPSGFNSADYDIDVATLFDGGRKMAVTTDFTVVLGATSATVTYLGTRTIAAGTRMVLGLGYKDASVLADVNSLRVKVIADTTYTLLDADHGKVLHYTNASGCVVTVPTGIQADHVSGHRQLSAGQVSFSGSGTTINNVSTQTKTSGQYALVALSGAGTTRNVFYLDGATGA